MRDATNLFARVLLAVIFIAGGWGKLSGYSGFQQYLMSLGMAGWMVVPTILLELGGGILLVLGAFTRLTGLALAAFCIATAVLVHWHPGDQGQMIHVMKNVAMAGGFLFVYLQGAGRLSLDHKLGLPMADGNR